jgi:hypothetical protein
MPTIRQALDEVKASLYHSTEAHDIRTVTGDISVAVANLHAVVEAMLVVVEALLAERQIERGLPVDRDLPVNLDEIRKRMDAIHPSATEAKANG